MKFPYFEILNALREGFGLVELERTQNPDLGDYYTNLAFKKAKELRKPPKVIAEELANTLNINGIEIEAVNGYLNFSVGDDFLCDVVNTLAQGVDLKRDIDKRVLVEFISANPTGPLNVANARAGAVGDAIVRILRFLGFYAESEYYVNDCGNQIINLALSVLHKINPENYPFPDDGYKGDYINELAAEFSKRADSFQDLEEFGREIAHRILEDQKKSLERYGIVFNNFVFESQIRNSDYPNGVLRALKDKGLLYYSKDDEVLEFKGEDFKEAVEKCKRGYALYFKSSEFGDEKDRVLIRSNGEPTYFFWDSAYHLYKIIRGYDFLIDIFGPDHHGYVPRIKGMVEALKDYYGLKGEYCVIINGQVNLFEGGKRLRMSKREGRIYTLDDLVGEVGNDAVRFFMLMRAPSSELNFDIDLAKKAGVENPVYYTQYAHARIKSLLDYAYANGIKGERMGDFYNEDERNLARVLQFFPYYLIKTLPVPLRETYLFGISKGISPEFSPNLLVDYLIELSHAYHRFYQNNRVVGDKRASQRLTLSIAVMNVLKVGLNLLGVSAPERML
ncbi:MAG: arginine--tRNA ligase [candidate division WOR-3 bacterium]